MSETAGPTPVGGVSGMEEVRRAGRTSVGVSAISIASYALTVARVTLVAFLFGVGRELDAFYLALAVPLFLQGLFYGTFQSVFVPAYQRALAADSDSARSLGRRSLAAAFGVLLLLALGTALFPGAIVRAVGGGLPPDVREHAARFLRLLSPLLLLEGGGQAMKALLQARKRYVLPPVAALAAIGASVGWLFLRRSRGVDAFVESTLVGGAVILAVMAAATLPDLLRGRGRSKSPAIEWRSYGIVLVTFALTGLNPLVDQAFAAYLPSGDISIYSYATRLYDVIWQIVFAGAGVVLLPLLSSQLAREKTDDAGKTLSGTFQASFLIFAPLAVGIAFAGRPFVTLAFERGAFTREASIGVWGVWAALSPALLFAAWGTIVNRLLYAAGRIRAILWAALVNVAMNAAADYVLMRRWGIVGIGAATTVRAIATWLVLAAFVPSDLRTLLPIQKERRDYARAILALVPLAAGAWFAGHVPLAPAVYVAALVLLGALQYGLFRIAVPSWVARLESLARRNRPAPL
ncbi:MAG: lipid II flippase MurJ [Acidobacteriota bacterium]